MAGKSCRQNQIAPSKLRGKTMSWSEKSTARKIYAIKVNDGELPGYQLIGRKSPVKTARKWIGKCKWKPPTAILVFSLFQVRSRRLSFLISVNYEVFKIAFVVRSFSSTLSARLTSHIKYSPSRPSVSLSRGVFSRTHCFMPALRISSSTSSCNSSSRGRLKLRSATCASCWCTWAACGVDLWPQVSHVILHWWLVPVLEFIRCWPVTSRTFAWWVFLPKLQNFSWLLISFSIQNFSTISHRVHRIIFVSVLSVSDVVYAIVHCVVDGNKEPKIHINAHIAGALSGVLLGFIWYGSHRHVNAKFNIIWWLSGACYLCFVVVVVIIINFS